LSEREVEVLGLVIRGLTNRQMAEVLFVSPKTVDHHIQHIYDKIGVSTRVGATLFALQHGLVEGGSDHS
jgi:DNA-binding NarL/FixJ family response regulator